MQSEGLPAYFKGGTALYKALKATNRFSEDIDLSVNISGMSRTQGDKTLEKATKKYNSLTRDASSGRTNRSEIISIYNYEPVVDYDSNDILQRFGKLKIEATSFTIAEPIGNLEVSTILYDHATTEQKQILSELYNVKPFYVQTITIERIFVDKLFAAEAYVRSSNIGNRAFEAAKHIYDLSVIHNHPEIISLMKNDIALKKLLDIRVKEEHYRLDGIPGILPKNFMFFNSASQNQEVIKAYEIMQNQYVLKSSNRIDFSTAISNLTSIQNNLIANPAWSNYQIKTHSCRL